MADGDLSSSVYYPPNVTDPCPPAVKYMLSEVSEACENLVNITTPFRPNIPRENRCDCLGSHTFSIQDDCILQRSDYYSILTDIEYCATKPSQYPSLAPIPTVSPSPSPSAIIPRVFGNSTTDMALRFPDSSPDSITNYILIFGFILICAAGSVYMAFAKKEVAKKDDSSGSKKSKLVRAAAEKATATDTSEGEPDEEEEDIELASRIDSDSESLPVQSPKNSSKKLTRSRREKKKKKHDKRKKKKVRQKAMECAKSSSSESRDQKRGKSEQKEKLKIEKSNSGRRKEGDESKISRRSRKEKNRRSVIRQNSQSGSIRKQSQRGSIRRERSTHLGDSKSRRGSVRKSITRNSRRSSLRRSSVRSSLRLIEDDARSKYQGDDSDKKTKKGRKHAVKNGDKQIRRTKTRTRVEYRDNGGTVGKQRSRSDSPPILAILNTLSHEDANPTLEKHISKKIRKHDYNELGLYE